MPAAYQTTMTYPKGENSVRAFTRSEAYLLALEQNRKQIPRQVSIDQSIKKSGRCKRRGLWPR